ncbi:TPA: hypothetical protein ACGL2S_000893 [Streptococcus agalactiae]|nr:hypothetical protein [Streptococcus agalactiae]
MLKEVLLENELLRDENRRLTNEMADYYFTNVVKANLLDIIVNEGYILDSTLEKCIAKLDNVDRQTLEKNWSDDND